ncbi:MAG: acyl-CoA dehydrogenase family protein [Desulfurococcales archaeon]|nr:acyl-CoA dehydrogenase family protein [Desulfurococcales archaeon]
MPLSGIEDISLSYGLNHYSVDGPFRSLARALSIDSSWLAKLGSYVGRDVLEVSYRVDALSPPTLVNWSVRGDRVDFSWVDPSERRVLRELLLEHGVNRAPLTSGSWPAHYASIYLVGDPGINCILTLNMQTAYALYKYSRSPLRSYWEALTGLRGDIAFGATWFTEIQGGSDLGSNQTVAKRIGDDAWMLEGYKYFASAAGIADVALVTARPLGAREGAKGLALFSVPRVHDGRLNFRVTRLKWKSGTRAVPTGEVELSGTIAYPVGDTDKGIYYVMEDLMVSRIANSVGAVGIARKAYLEAFLYALSRRAFGKRLVEHELVKRDLLLMEADIEASLALAFRAASLFSDSWREQPPYTSSYHYARLVTHIAKNVTAEAASRVTAQAMELLGGLGFLQEFPVERWHREAMITPIWEGTSNIQALDMLEAMARKKAHVAMLSDLEERIREAYDTGFAGRLLNLLSEEIKGAASMNGKLLEFHSKDLLRTIGGILATIEMEVLASDVDPRFHDVALVYYDYFVRGSRPRRLREGVLWDIISLRGELQP